MLNVMREVVMECSMRHNFDAEEMMNELLGVCVVSDLKKCKSGSKKSKSCVSVGVSCRFPIPYNGSKKENCCKAVCKNQGLYTQCETILGELELEFCTKCDREIKKSESGKPIYGRIEDRLAVGIMEYRDPSGKSPTPFIKIMKKLKISQEEVMEEASRLNIIIDEIHFREEEIGKKKEKGRPKKQKRKIELADDSTDLFAALVAKANEEESSDDESDSMVESAPMVESFESAPTVESFESAPMVESILDVVLDKVSIISENNKKEAAKEAEKLSKEAAKLAKEAAKEAEKLAKEAAKEAEKQKKEAEKQAEKQAKEAAKLSKEAAKLSKKEPAKKVTKKAEDKPKEEDKAKEEQDVVKRFEFEGVKYLKSKNTGIIYNMDEDVVGKWNEKTNKIDFNEMDSEEEADEYEE